MVFHAVGGYSDSLPLAKALDKATVVAYGMNDRSLPRAHGFPARIIAPGIYGMKNVKWLERIEVVDYDYQGYWQRSDGWDNVAEIKTASRIDVPQELTAAGRAGRRPGLGGGPRHPAGRGVAGRRDQLGPGDPAARAGQGGLAPVAPAPARRPPGTAPARGQAVDGRGDLQTSRRAPPHPSGASGYHEVEVVAE